MGVLVVVQNDIGSELEGSDGFEKIAQEGGFPCSEEPGNENEGLPRLEMPDVFGEEDHSTASLSACLNQAIT